MFFYVYVLKSMLGDILILVMWSKWVHKHLQEVSETFSTGENFIYISWFY